MKNILIFISFLCFQINLESENLVADSTQIDLSKQVVEIISPEIKMLNYLTNHFNRFQDSVMLEKPEWMIELGVEDTTCGYVISFKEGHTFKHQKDCNEWGEIVTVSLKEFKAKQVRNLVEELFSCEGYEWYNNKSEYRPEKNYETVWTFKIFEEKNFLVLEYGYSWI